MDYNTQKPKLVLPEYGRNIQLLVEQLLVIEDREERNNTARGIISIMGNMNPHLRDINDFKHKLWDHLAIMSDFKLDIDSPYPPPSIETLTEKPKQIPYNEQNIRYRYFGKIIEQLIDKASVMEEGEEKNALIEIIANHMKKLYLTWNKDTVEDDIILKTIEELSKGKITIRKDIRLSASKDLMNRPKKKKSSKRGDKR